MKLGFRNNLARLRTFFAYNFVPPAYANNNFAIKLDRWNEPSQIYKDCSSEHYFICSSGFNDSDGVYRSDYNTLSYTLASGTLAAACWNGNTSQHIGHVHDGELPQALPECHLSYSNFNNINKTYESGPATIYRCPGPKTPFPNTVGYYDNWGYDISGSDFVDADEIVNYWNSRDGRGYTIEHSATCGYNGASTWGQTGCKSLCGSMSNECFLTCQQSGVFGKFKSIDNLRNSKSELCRAPDTVGLSNIRDYINSHGAGLHDISDHKYYLGLNERTYGGTCYYAARQCQKQQIIALNDKPFTSEDLAFYHNSSRMSEVFNSFTCMDRPCDYFGSYSVQYADLLPDNCKPDGHEWEGGGSEPPPPPPPDPDGCTPDPNPSCECGKKYDTESCSCVDIEDFSRDCPEGKTWDETICGCQENDDSFTGNGAKFCELFETYLNKKGGTSVCSGNGITSNTTDFTGKKPDLILRNGIAIYNLSANDAAVIPELVTVNVVESEDMSDENREILNNQKGYIIYADVDGQNNGDSKLWEDVYPFYITLSGKVIPVFDKTANPDGSGGDSVNHLQMNVVRKRFQQRGLRWVAQGVSFQEAACRSGYIDFRAPYCDGYQIDPGCNINSNNVSSCKLKPVKPVGFFF